MSETVLPGLHRAVIPLPNNPLKATNSYIIAGPERWLVIDTGMDREECHAAMHMALSQLGVDLARTDFFITHMHADHSGLVAGLATSDSAVYCSRQDAEIINAVANSDHHWREFHGFALANGFPADEAARAVASHPGKKYSAKKNLEFQLVKEGDRIAIGDYAFTCLETPGHTRGHICLYEPRKKILVSGDHILGDITPNISLWRYDKDMLGLYLKSLDKTNELEVDLVLPGHRSIFADCRGRIKELKQHHQARADEVVKILETGRYTAYQTAARMKWDLTYASWDLFPPPQKWFATGEALAHLKYLAEKNLVVRELQDEQWHFRLKQ